MWGPGHPQPYASSRFEGAYKVYPVSFIDRSHLENGDKVILPPSALDRLASLRIDYPMLFQIRNAKEKKASHCGVLEFVADEGHAYIPYWMMQNLLLQEGDLVRFSNVSLEKGTYVKLRPHTCDFYEISNPKAVLEMSLRNYTCLTENDTFVVQYNNKRYHIDVVEAKPKPAVTIIETDCEVDFAPALDYKEPEKPAAPAAPLSRSASGKGAAAAGSGSGATGPAEEEAAPSFKAFSGSGNRIDGRAIRGNSAEEGAAATAAAGAAAATTAAAGPSGGGPRVGLGGQSRLSQSRLLRGGKAPAAPAPKEPEEPKFTAFSGKSYKLG